MKNIFRSPILFTAVLLVSSACSRKTELAKQDFSKEIRRGWELEQKALAFRESGSADSAFSYFAEARKMYEKAYDSTRIVFSLLKLAEIQYQYNDFAEMQATTVEALKYLNKESAQTYGPTIYNNLGIAYSQLEDYPRALQNYKKTLSYAYRPEDKLTVENNIANVYIKEGDYKKAYGLLKAASISPYINGDLTVKARILDNLGYSMFKLGKPDGLPLLKQGLDLREKAGDRLGLVTSSLHLAETLVKDRDVAIAFAVQAEEISAETHSPDDRLLALSFLAKWSDPITARGYSLQYFKIADSLQTARRRARNHFAAVKYDYKLEREAKLKSQANEARLQLRQSELEKARLTWLIAAICVLFGAVVAVYRIIRRNRRNRWKASYEAEVRISNRLHDELANDLHQAIVFTESKDLSEPVNKDKLLDNLDLVYKRARSLSRENASVGSEDFAERLRELISFYGSPGQNVVAKDIAGVPWQDLDEQQRVAVHRAVQELLVNMRKHSGCTAAVVQFGAADDKISISYSDNGKGMLSGEAAKNGLSIMENRIRDIKGTITFGEGAGKGFRARIEFPLSYV